MECFSSPLVSIGFRTNLTRFAPQRLTSSKGKKTPANVSISGPAKFGEMKGRTAWSDESGRSCILLVHIFICMLRALCWLAGLLCRHTLFLIHDRDASARYCPLRPPSQTHRLAQ